MQPAIVVLAHSRPRALKRLLGSLERATYHCVPRLVISLDAGAHPEVTKVAEEFISTKLNVQLIRREHRLGLRDHVIRCGDLTEKHGSVILLEDDLYIDTYFYEYATKALEFYDAENSVAGVALYCYEFNELTALPFSPMENGYDTYPMQLACSWGQCWTQNQWLEFKRWYQGKTPADLEKIEALSPAVKSWPETSWKKYFQAYLVNERKYFIYPYSAYSTNCSDAGGTHIQEETNRFQVKLPCPYRGIPKFLFCPGTERKVLYDSFMEPCGDFVWHALGLIDSDVTVDIQGSKPLGILKAKKFALTIKKVDTKISQYKLRFRPHEYNLLFPEEIVNGDFWLCHSHQLNKNSANQVSEEGYNYYSRLAIYSKRIMLILAKAMLKRIKNTAFLNKS